MIGHLKLVMRHQALLDPEDKVATDLDIKAKILLKLQNDCLINNRPKMR